VLIHEFGHFLTARLAGVRVLEFGVGFPPRAKVLRSKGETLYTLNWLPIGGFVKLEGEDGEQADDPRSFAAQPLLIRLGILAAGVVMNLATAFLIFTLIAWIATPLNGIRFSEVQPASPAATAGLQPGDAILAVNGHQYEFFGDRNALDDLQENVGKPVTLTVQRANGTLESITVTLRSRAEIDASPRDPPAGRRRARSASAAARTASCRCSTETTAGTCRGRRIAAQQTTHWFGLILAGLGDLVGGFVSNPTAAPPVAA
jgi:regulator of sigma E protease